MNFANLKELTLFIVKQADESVQDVFLSGYRISYSDDDLWKMLKALLYSDDVTPQVIMKFLKKWITNYRVDTQCSSDIVDAMKSFNLDASNDLKRSLIRNSSQKFSVYVTKNAPIAVSSPARSVPPLRSLNVHLSEKWLPHIAAREVSILMRDILSRLKLQDVTEMAWKKSASPETRNSPLHDITDIFNQLSYLMMNDILTCDSKHEVCCAIKYYLDVAEELLRLQNYDAMFCIVSTFARHPIDRLKDCWKRLSEKRMLQFKDFLLLIDNTKSFMNYRQKVDSL